MENFIGYLDQQKTVRLGFTSYLLAMLLLVCSGIGSYSVVSNSRHFRFISV